MAFDSAAASHVPLLSVSGLRVQIEVHSNLLEVVHGVDFRLDRGGSLGIVGESGSGKSVSAVSLLGLHPHGLQYRRSGEITLDGLDIAAADEPLLRSVRGGKVGIIFQDPLTALNPLHRIGDQIAEMAGRHLSLGHAAAMSRAVELLGFVGMGSPRRAATAYPHEFSGGMRQRVMIAIALAGEPKLLIADEPTTALDVTIQAQILDLFYRLREELGLAIILISHNLGVVAGLVDDVAVMYAGRFVEYGSTELVLSKPDHPYTRGLLGSMARIDRPKAERLQAIPGTPPAPSERLEGCAFAPRCTWATDLCRTSTQELVRVARDAGPAHQSACVVHPFPSAEAQAHG